MSLTDPFYDPSDRQNPDFHCKHGTFVGNPYGGDYICQACEDGEPAYKKYKDLVPGDRFMSPRASEGRVVVICAPGKCEHDARDEFSCHVHRAGDRMGQWFVVWHPDDEVEL